MPAAPTQKHRAARPPAPPLPAFEALDRTHRQVLETLDLLGELLQHLDDSGADEIARTKAQEIHAFFEGNARDHHAAEEVHVFPALLGSGDAALIQHVRRLQQDHGWLEEDWLELSPQIEAIARGYNWYDVAMLREALPIFRALYEEHIALEESLIYPEAKRRQLALGQGRADRGA